MYSGQDVKSDYNNTQTDRPNVQRINVMENGDKKKSGDELGDYEMANAGEGAGGGTVDGGAGGGAVDQGADKVKEEHKDKDKKDEGKKDTVVIVDPTSLDSGKEDCCTRFKKYCWENMWLLLFGCIAFILFLVFLGLYIDLKSKPAKVYPTPPTSPTPSTGVTTTKTTPRPGPTEPPAPVAIIQGSILTTENYTVALEDPTSVAYKTFENSLIAAMISFYAEDYKEYVAYYKETIVDQFEATRGQARVHFEIYFSQVDNNDEAPDAFTVLSDRLANLPTQLGSFLITEGSVSVKE